jgi:hypothetical protein
MYFIDRRKYEQCVSSQSIPSSITVNKYELSMFICILNYCEVD